MPLRFRLIALVTIVLLASLGLGGTVVVLNASRSVRTEMTSALLVGRQTIDNVVRGIDAAPDPRRELDNLVASFKGNRHLRVWTSGGATEAEVQPADDRSPFGHVPPWFVRLIGVAPETDRIPVIIDGRPAGEVVIETDPRNEILEVWDELSGSLIVLALFAGGTIPLIYLSIGRALRPLDRLASALEQVGQGDYAIRVSDPLTPELARLRDNFNRMAARLAKTDADNRQLHEQLLTLQEEERNDIARDLHDEIGPFLFAINVDIANIARLLGEGRTAELAAPTQAIAEAARHLQRQVRGMLGRLRPTGLAEFGLTRAVGEVIEFWRRRYAEIEYQVKIAPNCENLDDPFDTIAYRIVQEGLSNAVRHGRPRLIMVAVQRDPRGDRLMVEVADDGTGADDEPAKGYGLLGMEERVKAIGGTLRCANRADGGFSVIATLPYPSSQALPATKKTEAAQ
ncbi:MAG TPA: histidine kinase [Stellaceae bacterium]|nr:histidine kinase [Stellaceae bacterium]